MRDNSWDPPEPKSNKDYQRHGCMRRVLFICTGYIFRSLTAEYALRKYLGTDTLIVVASAGTEDFPHMVHPFVRGYLLIQGLDEFTPCVQISPLNTATLTQALFSGRFREKVQADKKNYHVVNAFTLLLCRLELWKARPKDSKPPRLPPSAMSA